MKPASIISVFSLCCLILSACSHYQMGYPSQTDGQIPTRIWIAPVIMEVAIPDVVVPLNRELREQVIRNSSLRLVENAKQADRILRVTVVDRERRTLARRSNDTGLSDVLMLRVVADFSLNDNDDQPVKTGTVSVDGQIFRTEGFNESSRQRMPSIIRDMADDIIHQAFLDW